MCRRAPQISHRKTFREPPGLDLVNSLNALSSKSTDVKDELDDVRATSYAAALRAKAFEFEKLHLAKKFLRELDEELTGGEIGRLTRASGGIKIVWNKRFSEKAGRADTKISSRDGIPMATINLSEKFLDNKERLLNTIAHEFCHVANHFLSHKRGHDALFKAWGQACTKLFGHRGIGKSETYHNYEMKFKYIWTCMKDKCGREQGRHSESIDATQDLCRHCGGELVQTNPVPRPLRRRLYWN